MSNYRALKTPLLGDLKSLFSAGRQTITVVSPFLSRFGLQTLHESVCRNQGNLQVTILTCVSVRNLSAGSIDIDALSEFCRAFPSSRVRNLPGLHAKVYIADLCEAIVTSANLTRGGLVGNYEYGIRITEARPVSAIHKDMIEYSGLGADLETADLLQLADATKELRAAARTNEKVFRTSSAWKKLSGKVNQLEESLLRQRVRGTSVNSVFADTVRYLLRSGPMRTQDLEARVQGTHPDMCDDTIDRVIDGVRFGKKWKHMVRNTQQFLKRRGEIEFRAGKWMLAN